MAHELTPEQLERLSVVAGRRPWPPYYVSALGSGELAQVPGETLSVVP